MVTMVEMAAMVAMMAMVAEAAVAHSGDIGYDIMKKIKRDTAIGRPQASFEREIAALGHFP